MYNYSISKEHVNMIEIILARSNQLAIQLNSLASVPTPLGRTCINRRSVQNGHSTLSPGNPEWPELTVYDFLDARFVILLAIDLLLLLVNIWFWAKNDQIWLSDARWMIFNNIRTDLLQFSVARKLILNGGAIRPTGLLSFSHCNSLHLLLMGSGFSK